MTDKKRQEKPECLCACHGWKYQTLRNLEYTSCCLPENQPAEVQKEVGEDWANLDTLLHLYYGAIKHREMLKVSDCPADTMQKADADLNKIVKRIHNYLAAKEADVRRQKQEKMRYCDCGYPLSRSCNNCQRMLELHAAIKLVRGHVEEGFKPRCRQMNLDCAACKANILLAALDWFEEDLMPF